MDARLVWNMWRRILTDDDLAELSMRAHGVEAVAAGLNPAELAVFADYASTPQATSTNIGMYRRGLIRIALSALNRIPLSQHLLYTSGLNIDDVASDFVRTNGYVDYGPNSWRLAGTFVDYLATRPEFASPVQQDVFSLDRALVALALHLGKSPVALWPDNVAENVLDVASVDRLSVSFVATRAAVVVASHHDLTSWIENPQSYDPTESLVVSPRYWMLYFPAAESMPAYAELSARSARIFDLLATPKTAADVAQMLGNLSAAEVLNVIDRLGALGIIVSEGDSKLLGHALTDDAYVMLDPGVEILDAEVAGHRLLCHSHFEVGMAVPPGDGLADFVGALAGKPVCVGALHKGYDDRRLVDTMLAALWQHGFLHRTSQTMPSDDELARLRRTAEKMRRTRLCHTVVADLNEESADEILARIEAEATTPELQLRCAQLAKHAKTLADLANLRKKGRLCLHHTIVWTRNLACGDDIILSLRRLGAAVLVEDVAWPTPEESIAGLDALTRAGVPVHALLTPDHSLLDAVTRNRTIAWARSAYFTGLCLKLDVDALWPTTEATEDDFIGIFEAIHSIEDAFGDVQVVNLPSDEVLLGNAASSSDPAELSETARRFRLAYLRWRVPLLKSVEVDNTFSQTPEAEEKLVRLREDLLPNHPELLHLEPNSVIVDVCGGNGRVARRLSSHVGEDGLVISVEMLRCVTDRARRFACERGFTNVQFRTGLAQRIPLPDGAADAAVNEWTGAIWQLGLGPSMVAEMARVVRSGGRIAVTHRLVRLPLTKLRQPWVQFDDIYTLMQAAFACPDLKIIREHVWGLTVSTLVGEKATAWRKHYVPRVVNPFDVVYTDDDDPGPRTDVCLTIIAERS